MAKEAYVFSILKKIIVLQHFLLCTVGVTTNGSDPKWKTVCVLSGYHNRTIYDVHW